MSDLPPTAPPPADTAAPPPTPPAKKRAMPIPWQLAIGFFTPGALLLLHAIGLRLHVGALGEGGSRVVSYIVTYALTILCAVLLWTWSGRRGWRWIRVGIVLFLVGAAALAAWLLGAVFGLFAHH